MKASVSKLILVALLVSSLLAVAACAKPAPAPAPAPPQKVDLEIYTSKFGSVAYIMGAAWADIINKYSDRLRMTMVETAGSVDNVKRVDADTPAKRARVIFVVGDATYWPALAGTKPFEKPHTSFRAVSVQNAFANFFVTYDAKIKTPQHLVGKRVNIGEPGSSTYMTGEFILDSCWGIFDKVKVQTLGFDQAKFALMDGTIDVMFNMATVIGQDFVAHPSLEEPLAKGRLYFIGPSREDLKRGNQATGWAYGYKEMPAKAVGPNQPEPVQSYVSLNAWFATTDVSDDIVYEVMRVGHQNYKEFEKYATYGKLYAPAYFGWLPVKSEAELHPGALRYYKEHKLPITKGE